MPFKSLLCHHHYLFVNTHSLGNHPYSENSKFVAVVVVVSSSLLKNRLLQL